MGLLDFLKGRELVVALPVSLAKVGYMVAGERAYDGDLIITQNVIYYFPHTDLIRRRIDNVSNFSGAVLGGGLGAALGTALANTLRSSKHGSDLPTGLDLSTSVEEKLDAHIKQVKAERGNALLSESLPSPMRFEKNAIEQMRPTFAGFTFEAGFDNHDFRVSNSKLLRAALKTGTYLS